MYDFEMGIEDEKTEQESVQENEHGGMRWKIFSVRERVRRRESRAERSEAKRRTACLIRHKKKKKRQSTLPGGAIFYADAFQGILHIREPLPG
jgi:hypothetical protein